MSFVLRIRLSIGIWTPPLSNVRTVQWKKRLSVPLLSSFVVMLYEDITASVVWWSEFLAANPEVPGSIPGDTRFSE
jgi:hypothetical protein